MKAVFILPALLALVSAAPNAEPQLSVWQPKCVCKVPICPDAQPQKCQCEQQAAMQCYMANKAAGQNCPQPTPTICTVPSFSIGELDPTHVITFGKRDFPLATKVPEVCECEEVFCIQSWPESCYCANNAKQKCYEKCGGDIPLLQVCEDPVEPITLEPIKTLTDLPPVPTFACPCKPVACIQSWPESCYCANAAKKQCYDRCGGPVPTYQVCEPPPPVTTKAPTTIKTTTKPTPTTKTGPTGTHQACGGFVISPKPCPTGHVCIDDPFISGCGMACDRPGICVPSKLCGGFAALPCPTGMKCVDDPRDSCDPKKGGADCGGLCVWPH